MINMSSLKTIKIVVRVIAIWVRTENNKITGNLQIDESYASLFQASHLVYCYKETWNSTQSVQRDQWNTSTGCFRPRFQCVALTKFFEYGFNFYDVVQPTCFGVVCYNHYGLRIWYSLWIYLLQYLNHILTMLILIRFSLPMHMLLIYAWLLK